MPTNESQIDMHDISLLVAQKPNDIIKSSVKRVQIDENQGSRINSKLSQVVVKSSSPT